MLLVFNYWAGARAMRSQPRVQVPYSPFFLQQVTAGHVAEITSKGTAIQGTFTRPERYGSSKATTRFKTEVPAFADTNALSQLPLEARTRVLRFQLPAVPTKKLHMHKKHRKPRR